MLFRLIVFWVGVLALVALLWRLPRLKPILTAWAIWFLIMLQSALVKNPLSFEIVTNCVWLGFLYFGLPSGLLYLLVSPVVKSLRNRREKADIIKQELP